MGHGWGLVGRSLGEIYSSQNWMSTVKIDRLTALVPAGTHVQPSKWAANDAKMTTGRGWPSGSEGHDRSSCRTWPPVDSIAHTVMHRLHRDNRRGSLPVGEGECRCSRSQRRRRCRRRCVWDAFPSCPLFDSLSVDAVRAFTRASASLVHRSLPRAALRRHDGRASPSARRRRPRVETPESSTKAMGSAASVMSAVVARTGTTVTVHATNDAAQSGSRCYVVNVVRIDQSTPHGPPQSHWPRNGFRLQATSESGLCSTRCSK